MFFPNVEKRESGPRHLDRASDEFYAPESEVTQERAGWADDMWGVLTPEQEQQLRGWE